MSSVKEILPANSYKSEEGDVLPLADKVPEFDRRPPLGPDEVAESQNAVLTELALDKFEDEARRNREKILADRALESAGPYVTLEDYYQDQLDLLDFVSGSFMRKGFKKGGSKTPQSIGRYKDKLSEVEQGAHRNHQNAVHQELLRIYRAEEIIDAGFEPEEVMFDAKTTMRNEIQSRYGGPDNKSTRATLRKKLRGKSRVLRR